MVDRWDLLSVFSGSVSCDPFSQGQMNLALFEDLLFFVSLMAVSLCAEVLFDGCFLEIQQTNQAVC